MKKIILLFFVIAFSGFINLSAQSLAGYKICINPGHRGYNASYDRYIPETGFWESEGNLAKGLYLKAILEGLGANVFITRTTQIASEGTESLSQIVAFANSNNVDYFHSIHSNATGTATKANYTLILFQGRTTAPTYAGSLTMANFIGDNILASDRTVRKMIAGDFDFYGTGQAYLGVFKGLNMPGTLSEGSFHDYIPESWRLKNDSYLKHEAWAIARSFLQYFNGGTLKNGILAGIVRDVLETVPASYSPLSGTLDNYKPINQIKVRLEPGSKTYTGDNYNNGYYFFDDLVPGNYKLIFESSQMKTDTINTVVKANESVFNDRLMSLNPILDPPKIVSYSPADSVNEVSNVSSIVVQFDIRMNLQETVNAVKISPSVAGTFSWDSEYKKMTFIPSKGYVAGTKYKVSISTAAKTLFGINLPQTKTFSFTTRSKLNLVSTYPVSGATDISTSVLMSLKFEKGIDGSTLGGKISITDDLGNPVDVAVKKLGSVDGIIEFEPRTPLNNNATYRITLKEGIGDIEYVTLPKQVVIEYKTEKNYTFTGNILDGFESDNIWQSPLLSTNTTGFVAIQTAFAITYERKLSGSNSGKLEYGFSGNNGGVIDLALLKPIILAENSTASFGFWLFGDNSKNTLEYRFIRQNSSEVKVKVDTINWTGWKLKKILLSGIAGSGTIQFKSISVVQSTGGNLSGKLFFDDCTSNIVTDVQQENSLPTEFRLEQNYPNPFNPSTKIRFSIPGNNASGIVPTTLKIFNLLGQELATLVNENKSPGNYEVIFNGNGLASGIYIYRIESGNYSASKKLLLIK